MAITRQLLRALPIALSLSQHVSAADVTPGAVTVVGNTLVSAMMMFLGSEDKVYIIDKVEANPGQQINGHPSYAAEYDLATNTVRPMDVITNPFCAAGMHMPDGSYATFGGNAAVGPGSVAGDTGNGFYDTQFQDYNGLKAIRTLNPCKNGDDPTKCNWNDNSTFMAKQRWYASTEALADGTVVIVGGMSGGGFINRNYPNVHPDRDGAESTYEFYPASSRPNFTPVNVNWIVNTSGLNTYAHLYLMPSGKIFAQANYSTILWDPETNAETYLPDMPNQITRVYPASGATAMLPLTPANNYTPSIIFCGGNYFPENLWGDYANPVISPWKYAASKDCQRITPEPLDKSGAQYEQDDDMIENGRTMGQFIALPDGTYAVVNGGANGTAAYAGKTGDTPHEQMPFGESLACNPVGKPAIYNPLAPKGSRWSNAGLGESKIARLYHSSAILLPDGSVFIAGSNPNSAYNNTSYFPTEYRAEKFYPLYFGANRPKPKGVPTKLTYGGTPFDITLESSDYSGDSNAAAANTTVRLIRPGWTTHALNMGQRMLELDNTYTVSNNGTITLHVSQVPPNANILTPGPVLVFVSVNGIPSIGTIAIVGSGSIGKQTMLSVDPLPDSVKATSSTSGSGSSGSTSSDQPAATQGSSTSKSISTGVIAIIAAGGAAALIAAIILYFCCCKRARNPRIVDGAAAASMGTAPHGMGYKDSDAVGRDSAAFIPLQQYNNSAWNVNQTPGNSQVDLHHPSPAGGGYGEYNQSGMLTPGSGGGAPPYRDSDDGYYRDASPQPGGNHAYPQYNDGPPEPYRGHH